MLAFVVSVDDFDSVQNILNFGFGNILGYSSPLMQKLWSEN